MPKEKETGQEEEVAEVIEEQPEQPEVVEDPEPKQKPKKRVQEAPVDLDSIPLVFSKGVVETYLRNASARISNAVEGAMLMPQALPPGNENTMLLFAIQAVRPGGVVVVPEVYLGNDLLEDLEYIGPVKDLFAFRK